MTHPKTSVLRSLLLLGAAITSISTGLAESPSYRRLQLDDKFYAEGAVFADINRDGAMDVAAGPWWYEGPGYQVRHEIYEPKPFDPLKYSDNFIAAADDLDGDGWTDIVVIGFPGLEASWYRNPGSGAGRWVRHVAHSPVDNESAMYVDLTGDGRREIVCSSGGKYGYATPDPSDPTRPWVFHAISSHSNTFQRFTHGLGVGDVDGDGRNDLLERGGWWRQPASLAGDPVWQKHEFAFSRAGGAQMCVVDLNADGLPDVVTSKEAHGYGLSWFEQVRGRDGVRSFREHMILSEDANMRVNYVQFSQLHAVTLADVNGDGTPDIVTGKRWWAHGPDKDPDPMGTPVVYAFIVGKKAGGEVTFSPMLIDDASGIGTQFDARDVNGDKRADFAISNKRGTFVLLSKG
ncbi:MAG: VCBS repeat-containing protein [Opitutaceae bacterium]|nr:VCBS repeat-containing protein [Opitutaceae bacterium]